MRAFLILLLLVSSSVAVAAEKTSRLACLRAALSRWGAGDVFGDFQKDYNSPYDIRAAWLKMRTPATAYRPAGIEHLREVGKRGWTLVLPEEAPVDPAVVEQLKLLNGINVVFAGKRAPSEPVKLPGVVLHHGNAPRLSRFFVGEANPYLEGGEAYGLLDNKWAEYSYTRVFLPNAMPESYNLLESLRNDPNLAEHLSEVQRDVHKVYWNPKLRLDSTLRPRLEAAVESLLASVRRKFPDGALIKLVDEYQTGDEPGRLFKSGKMDPKKIVDGFIRRLQSARRSDIDLSTYEDRSTQLVYQMLFEPQKVFVQQQLPVSSVFRVEFVDGEGVYSRPRHGHEYTPAEAEAARKFVTQTFRDSAFPIPMTGSADIAILKDGSKKFIEFGFGSEGGFIDAYFSPVSANRIIERLTGKPTPFLKELERLSGEPEAEQRKFLSSLVGNAKDNYVIEISEWFRDRILKEWEKTGDAGAANRQLSALFDRLGTGELRSEIREIAEAGRKYLRAARGGKPRSR